jgi:hypothetical protein
MLTVLMGPILALHLMTYQAGESLLTQTLVTDHINRIVAVHYEVNQNA